MRTIKHLVTAGLVGGVFIAIAFIWVWCNRTEHTIAAADLGRGCHVRVWTDSSLPSMGYPTAFYSISRGTTILIPKRCCGCDLGEDFGLRTAFADNGQLVCVYSVLGRFPTIIILFDHRTQEAWPSEDLRWQAWIERVRKVAQENPGEPLLGDIATAWGSR